MTSKENWNTKRYVARGKALEFAFAGAEVQTIRFGGIVELELNDDFQTQIGLWMSFSITQYGQTAIYTPQEATTLAPLLAAIGTRLVEASADSTGFLTLVLDNGMTVRAPTDETGFEYEAWQIEDKHWFQAVCAIGGNVAIFPPISQSPKIKS